MFGGFFQPTHLILVLVVVLIVFGPGKLPEAAKSMGKAMRDMRASFAGESETENKPQNAAAAEVVATSTAGVGSNLEKNKVS